MSYPKFRVRTPVKTFRDLEVYQEAVKLSAEIFNLKIPQKRSKQIEEEIKTLKENSKIIIKLLVESYDNKFEKIKTAEKELDSTVQIINLIVAKLDFLMMVIEDQEWKNQLLRILKRYQRLKIKILNLKRAWLKVFK